MIKTVFEFLQKAKWLAFLPVLLAAFMAFAQFSSQKNVPLAGDAGEYFEMALGLRQTGALLSPYEASASAERGFAYPALLAPLISADEAASAVRVRFANAVLFVLCAAGVYLLALPFGNLAGVGASLLWAINPIALLYAAQGGVEMFYSLCVILSFLLLLRWLDRKTPGWAAFAGLAFGFSLLCRSTLFLFPPCAVLLAWLLWRPQKRQIALFLLAAYLPMAVWALRNARLFGEFVPLERGRGNVILFEASRGIDGGRGLSEVFAAAQGMNSAFGGLSHEDKLLALGAMARKEILAHPVAYAGGSVRRAWKMAGIYARQGWWLVPLTLLGLCIMYRAGSLAAGGPYLAALAYGMVIYSPLSVSDRFMLPFFPFYFALACSPLLAVKLAPAGVETVRPVFYRLAAVAVCALLAYNLLFLGAEAAKVRRGDGKFLSAALEDSFSDSARKSDFLVRRGMAFNRAGNKTMAARAFESAEAIKPVNPNAPLSLCVLLMEKNKFEDATAACGRAVDAARSAGNDILVSAALSQRAEAEAKAREFPRTSLPLFPEKEKAVKSASKARHVVKRGHVARPARAVKKNGRKKHRR